MAARLTDRQKKKIVADYLETESYNATAKMNGVSKDTVKRIVLNCEGFFQKAQQKRNRIHWICLPLWIPVKRRCKRQ